MTLKKNGKNQIGPRTVGGGVLVERKQWECKLQTMKEQENLRHEKQKPAEGLAGEERGIMNGGHGRNRKKGRAGRRHGGRGTNSPGNEKTSALTGRGWIGVANSQNKRGPARY